MASIAGEMAGMSSATGRTKRVAAGAARVAAREAGDGGGTDDDGGGTDDDGGGTDDNADGKNDNADGKNDDACGKNDDAGGTDDNGGGKNDDYSCFRAGPGRQPVHAVRESRMQFTWESETLHIFPRTGDCGPLPRGPFHPV